MKKIDISSCLTAEAVDGSLPAGSLGLQGLVVGMEKGRFRTKNK